MALMIADTTSGNRQGVPCSAGRDLRMHALVVFVGHMEVAQWH